jgi:hypothetical protein
MKIRITAFLVLTFLLISPNMVSAAEKPLRANIFLSWQLTDADAVKLSQWDLIILDAEIGARQPKLIKKIRARNPRIKILAYVSAVELQKDQNQLALHAPLRSALRARTPESAYARRPDGAPISFWPTANLMNVTGAWQTILPKFIHEKILSTKLWDGIMLDNVWNGVSWYVGATDLDSNQIEDSPMIANAVWNSAMQTMISQIKKQSPRALIIANGSEIYSELDGFVFENFGQKNWYQTITRVQNISEKKKLTILNATSENLDEPSVQQMRFGLGSALLFDAYFSYDFGDTNHASLWWFADYNLRLGNARGPAVELQPNVWSRAFKNGKVMVNVSTATTTLSGIELGPQSSRIILGK